MKDLTDILIWKQKLGLLPIHLKPESNNSNYVMLNGGYGDFCLQTLKDESNVEEYYSKSWSSNTKNFLVLEDENVNIYNWLRKKPEVVSQKLVIDNFDKFYDYILSKSNKSSKDVVPHIIDIFRQFRNLTFEKTNPVEALNLLFILLTSIENDVNNLDFNKWNLKNVHIPADFEYYVNQIKEGVSNIKPELDLIIRHSAGALFQEAQKEVLFFDPQRELFGGSSKELKTKNNLYSSIHYTPPYLSRTIVENALKYIDLDLEKIKIFDPACGSSEFLIEALKQLKQLNYNGYIEIIGWDSSETAINTSNFLLKYEQRTIWKEKLEFKIKQVEDSLTETWENNYNLILMNPPFVSWELLRDKNSRDAVRVALGPNFNGKPNQASAFFYKSINHLDKNGTIGCVMPSSILTLDSYKKIRNEVNDLISIKLVGKLGNFVFEDALTDVSLIIGQKPKTNQVPTIIWTRNEKGIAQNALRNLRKMTHSNEITVDKKDFSIYKPIKFPVLEESWKTISLENNNLYREIERLVVENKLVRVENIFSVKQGIRTGNNKVFKLSATLYDGLPLDEKRFFRLILDNDSINRGVLLRKNYVWYPYNVKDGTSLINSEEELIKVVPTYYKNYLAPNKQLLIGRTKKVPNWWSLSDRAPRLLPLDRKILSTEFGMSNSFAFDERGDYIAERANEWIPKKKFTTEDYLFYLAIFSSPFFDSLLSIYSKQLAGGNWYDLGRKFTSQIPIPNILNGKNISSDINRIHSELPIYKKIVDFGSQLSNGDIYNKSELNELIKTYIYLIG